jgi:hypothetical protein
MLSRRRGFGLLTGGAGSLVDSGDAMNADAKEEVKKEK